MPPQRSLHHERGDVRHRARHCGAIGHSLRGGRHAANNAFELFGAQLPDFSELESFFASAESWSEQTVGVPYDQVVNTINDDFNPFTLFDQLEGPIGQDIQDLLNLTGVQQDLIAPFFGDLVSGIEYLEGLVLPQ